MSSTEASWLCGRCLATLNATSYLRARSTRDADVIEDFNGSPTEAHRVRIWAEDRLSSGDWRLELDAMPRAYEPITTWHGDPVCISHLWELRQQEFRRA